MANHKRKTQDEIILDYEEIVRKKNAELAELRRLLRTKQGEEDTAELIRETAFEIAALPLDPPKWMYTPTKSAGKWGCPVTIWSDLHYGEVVHPDEIGGVNKFNTKIAAERVRRLAERVVDLSFNHMGRARADYPGIVVCLGGDMIGGDIHDELRVTNEKTVLQCCQDVANLLAAALRLLAKHFGRVLVVGVVGNHGRITPKLTNKQRVFHNYDWDIYCRLESFFQEDPRVQFYIPSEADAHFRVYNTRFMLTHGDSLGVRGGDGIIGAIGPIMRGAVKVGRSEAQIGRDFDYLLIGHYHEMLDLPGCFANGPIKGYDEYARLTLRARYAPAQQWLFFVNPKYGITARWPVFLQDPLKGTRADEWVSVWTGGSSRRALVA